MSWETLTLSAFIADCLQAFKAACMTQSLISMLMSYLLGQLSSMGYGFIQYKTPKAAQKAIRQLQVSTLSKHQSCVFVFLHEIGAFF